MNGTTENALKTLYKITDTDASVTASPRSVLAGLQDFQRLAHQLAARSGWWIDPETGEDVRTWPKKFLNLWIGNKIMLCVCELSEAYEAFRKGWLRDDHLPHLDGTATEFADTLIRIGDLAEGIGLPVWQCVIEKLAYNQQRADHKLENRAAEGGKSI